MAEKTHVELESEQAEVSFEVPFDASFDPGEREGLVPVGTYLHEAANRLGIYLDDDITEGENGFHWTMLVKEGIENLSWPTQEEFDNLSEEARVKGERLAFYAKIDKPGRLVVELMETEKIKTEEQKQQEKFQEFQKNFSEMPFEKKVTSLMALEAITLGETFNYVLGLPYAIGDQVMGVMAGFGIEMDKADKAAKHPPEHNGDADGVSSGSDNNEQ